MKVKINRHAVKVLNQMLEKAEEGEMIRVYITENHGNHAHYDLKLDQKTEHDEVVQSDKDIPILLDTRDADFLDGVWIQYFHVPQPGFTIYNPAKEHHHH
ncbi:iron-sulfur cluster assembly accessory protein [Niallia sp. Sow4_A1]|jgi:iron-sulfur cluster assembly protein|uniref:Iron-sulfur cluster assembly accessory protein n=1 Tax=Niallia hominis TaxID=3133173 RepID=A0ABV1F7B9_9BACI|nr:MULTISPECIES: heme biosynthesis protein HemY [Bacillaceae]MCF2649607.1 iron-sulfur cluster assembly accessory protein [Niallia circulans]MCM3362128.1 iron-sulfur cluster assembly accessory protein [Niallia sp. MER TA 168]CAI9386766.1 Iron-sulfur cluster insertion protein ErpA [Bacillus sp. T2.9-1]